MTVVTIQQRRATSTEWGTKNPILKAGEIGFEIDTGKVKCGNGITPWNELVYISGDVNAVQNTGQSTTQVMSQKAVTDELEGKANTSSLGTAATKNVTTSTTDTTVGRLLKVGDFGVGVTSGNVSSQPSFSGLPQGMYSLNASNAGGVENPIPYASAVLLLRATSTGRYGAIQSGRSSLFYHYGESEGDVTTVNIHHTGNILTDTGQSTLYPMTQKAVTDALEGKVDKVTGSGLVKTPPTNGKPQAMLDGDWVDAPTKSIDWVIHNGGALTIDSSMNGKFILVKGDSTLTLDVHLSLPVGFNVTILPDDSKDATAHTITLDKHTSNTIIGGLTTVTGVCSVALIPSTTIFAVAGSIE